MKYYHNETHACMIHWKMTYMHVHRTKYTIRNMGNLWNEIEMSHWYFKIMLKTEKWKAKGDLVLKKNTITYHVVQNSITKEKNSIQWMQTYIHLQMRKGMPVKMTQRKRVEQNSGSKREWYSQTPIWNLWTKLMDKEWARRRYLWGSQHLQPSALDTKEGYYKLHRLFKHPRKKPLYSTDVMSQT